MAEGKKKIVVYADWINSFEDLTDRELGILFRHFFKYVNDQNPVLKDRIVKVAWKPIESTLKRDLNQWNEKAPARVEKAKKAGLASAKKRAENQLKPTKSNKLVKNPTKSTVSVSVSVNDKVIKKEVYRSFAHLTISREECNKLWEEWTEEQIIEVLDSIENWGNNKNVKSLYLTARKWLTKDHPKKVDEKAVRAETLRKGLESGFYPK